MTDTAGAPAPAAYTSIAERLADVRALTKQITDRYDRRYWLGCIEKDEPPYEMLQALADAGLLGLGVPEEFGGSGGEMIEEAAYIEGLGLAGIPQHYMIVPNFARRMVAKHGTARQRAEFLPTALQPRPNTCFAITEAEAGTNSFAMRTKAVRDGDGWRINGQKVFISGAGTAAQMLLVAKTGGFEPGAKARLSLFIVALPDAAVTTSPMRMTVAAPEKQYTVHFDNLYVPGECLVGEEGSGARNMFSALNAERILAAAGALGLGTHALDKAAAYARTRAPFGAPIGSYQGVAHPLARAYMQLEAARQLTYQAAEAIDRGETPGLQSNIAKFLASEAAHQAVDAAVQTHGGSSFDADSDVWDLYQQIRTRRIAPLNNEMILNFVAEKALGLPRSY
jgi:acyl-CoA dehydrogenase